jgi:hypothetical protein
LYFLQVAHALEQSGLISPQPGVPRSIVVQLDRSALPELNPGHSQPVIRIDDQGVAFCGTSPTTWEGGFTLLLAGAISVSNP